ncbi:hypothetical protein BKA56DRAFT_129299 [Ilyonectria sp. MPI-CAGE-AT-0026]|nr:hypothetical protein BKA56DRAFT_129299 [Ilyonectria sp. MPI-CAGE-AT-0026]
MVKCVSASARHAAVHPSSCGFRFQHHPSSVIQDNHQRTGSTDQPSRHQAKDPFPQGEVPSRYPSFPHSPRRVPVNLLPPPPLHYRSHYHHYRSHHHHNHHHRLSLPRTLLLLLFSLLHPPSQSPFQPPAPNAAHRSPLTHAVRPVPVQGRAPLASRRSATARPVFLFFPSRTRSVALSRVESCGQSHRGSPEWGDRESQEKTIGAIGCAGCAVVVSFVLGASLGELRWTIELAQETCSVGLHPGLLGTAPFPRPAIPGTSGPSPTGSIDYSTKYRYTTVTNELE